MSEEVFGQLISTWRIQQSVITTLREWLPIYLAAVERQEGLEAGSLGRPGNEINYYPGIDLFSAGPGVTQPTEPPLVIVTAAPEGPPEMSAVDYLQAYEVQVACIVRGATEEEAIMRGSLYGAALMLLAQVGGLGGLAERTVMTSAPTLEFVDPESAQRRLVRSVVGYTVHVPSVVAQQGPWAETVTECPEISGYDPEAEPGQQPTITKTKLTIKAEDV